MLSDIDVGDRTSCADARCRPPIASVRAVNETITSLYENANTRTVTIAGPSGSPAIKVKLLHAAAAAIAGVILAPRFTAVASIAAMVKGMRVSVDAPPVRDAAAAS